MEVSPRKTPPPGQPRRRVGLWVTIVFCLCQLHRGESRQDCLVLGDLSSPSLHLEREGSTVQAFDYFAPTSVDQAIAMLAQHKGRGVPLAGGTDLLPQLKNKLATPAALIDLKKLSSLRGISYDASSGLRIGAMTTHSDILANRDIAGHYPVLSQAAGTIGSVQVRNRGTVGGNLCHAVPSADMAPPLIALGATAVIQGSAGQRELLLEDFFTGPNQTVLKDDELLVALKVPPAAQRSAAIFLKHGVRKAMEIAIVCVASCVSFQDGVCAGARITLGAVAPTPLRARQAESLLSGKALTQDLAAQAGTAAAQEARPITDMRGSIEYRRAIVQALTSRTLMQAAALAR